MRFRFAVPLLILFVAVAWLNWPSTSAPTHGPLITVERGSIIRRAIASGQVDPVQETQVNTQLTGFVRTLHTQLGKKVSAGEPLAEVWPALTEQDLLRAERGLQQAIEGEEAAAEFHEGQHLLASMTRFLQGQKNLDRMQQSAQRGRRMAEESLKLLREGKVEIDGRLVDFVVRAPVAGHVLQLVRQGDPITPASSYGLGTVLAVIGDLDRPVFRGTVDEIDVGRLRTGMPASVTLGALPGVVLTGAVVEIGLRARRQDNAALFDVRIQLEPRADVMLRAGYSAVAEVEVARVDEVLVLPERCLVHRGGESFVTLLQADGKTEERAVKLGLGDGLRIEIVDGLPADARVLEPLVR
jgi:HlyD family secretion protein